MEQVSSKYRSKNYIFFCDSFFSLISNRKQVSKVKRERENKKAQKHNSNSKHNKHIEWQSARLIDFNNFLHFFYF